MSITGSIERAAGLKGLRWNALHLPHLAEKRKVSLGQSLAQSCVHAYIALKSCSEIIRSLVSRVYQVQPGVFYNMMSQTAQNNMRSDGKQKKRQKSINHFLITWIIFFSPKYYLAKLLSTWVMVFERFSSMSLWSTTGPTVSERRDGDLHTAHCFLYECMLHLVSAWLRDQNKTTLWLKNQPAGSHVLPRTKVSTFCWKTHTDVSMLRGEWDGRESVRRVARTYLRVAVVLLRFPLQSVSLCGVYTSVRSRFFSTALIRSTEEP